MDNVATPKVHSFDKVVHFGAYFLLTLSWMLAFIEKLSDRKKILYIASLVFVYGIVIEVLQATITAHRQADYKDMLANLAGVLFAVCIFYLFLRKKQKN